MQRFSQSAKASLDSIVKYVLATEYIATLIMLGRINRSTSATASFRHIKICAHIICPNLHCAINSHTPLICNRTFRYKFFEVPAHTARIFITYCLVPNHLTERNADTVVFQKADGPPQQRQINQIVALEVRWGRKAAGWASDDVSQVILPLLPPSPSTSSHRSSSHRSSTGS